MISLIAALNSRRVIGINNTLPWRLPGDLKRFKQLTLNKPVIMGRPTLDSIGKPLPGRRNIVITSDMTLQRQDCVIVHSIEDALTAALAAPEIMIIGGASIYGQFLPFADRLYLTMVDAPDIAGDAYFPQIDFTQWREVERSFHSADNRHSYNFTFLTLERLTP